MSKVNRFSLEERDNYQNHKVIYDKDVDSDIELNNIYPIIDLLNKLDEQIVEFKKQLEEKEKDNQFLKKMYISEKTKNDNYRTEKYGLDKPVQELRKIKLSPKEKEIYYKGFDNCERQFSIHIVELQQQLKSQPTEIVEKIKKQIFNHFNVKNMEEYESLSMLDSLFTADAVTDMLDDILKEYQK